MDRKIIATNKKFKKDFAPDTEELWVHPEESDALRLNDFIVSVGNDVVFIDSKIKEAGDNVSTLLKTTSARLDDIKNKILHEKERLQDIIILCNKYTDYESVVRLTKNDFTGDFTYEDNAFSSKVSSSFPIAYNITDVLGNGYEGNAYVYDEWSKAYISKSLDTSKRSAIKDNSVSTYWEYSRITASEDEKYVFSGVNFDAEEAKCTLYLHCADNVNKLLLYSEDNSLIVSDIQISNDKGITYKPTGFVPTAINSKEDQYNNSAYIYSSGILSFPSANYIKVTLESGGYTYDTIAFDKQTILEDNSKDIVSTDTVILETARRHAIKINDLTAYSNTYITESKAVSREIITDNDVNVISLFCNTYIPQGMSNDDLRFILTVNGKDYDVVPVNSQQNGKKIIRFSQGTMKSDYTQYLTEPIKSAKLTIIMKTRNGLTPYVNNIKILLGDEE